MKEKKGSFSGSIGFVLAAAGSAVGVGNIWRFPYLCAKDGGGLFLIIYLVLVLTFGSVSYTHLDVYKRQASLSGEASLDAFSGGIFAGIPQYGRAGV